MNKYFLFSFCLAALGCSTTETPSSPPSYIQAIEAHSAGEVEYVGIYNTFNYRTTILNTAVQNAIIDRRAALYLWDEPKKQQELALLQTDNLTMTKVFVSFYTPNRRDDNLSTPKTIWALYLETPQGRYTGVVKRVRTSQTELTTLYPYHNRFTTAYMVEFPVAL